MNRDSATGDDLGLAARAIHDDPWGRYLPDGEAARLAQVALAALDLPGRERALRDLVRTVQWYGTGYIYEPPGGDKVLLDPTHVTVVIAADHLTEVERLTAERDAANAALADVAQKLDEARMERDNVLFAMEDLKQANDGLHGELDEWRRLAFDYRDAEGDDVEHAWHTLKDAIDHYRKVQARQHAGGEDGAS